MLQNSIGIPEEYVGYVESVFSGTVFGLFNKTVFFLLALREG
jgi:hypothetical protein